MFDGGKIGSLLLAFVLTFFVWVIHNLTLEYSAPVQLSVRISTDKEGYQSSSVSNEQLLFRCTATGYSLIRMRGLVRDHSSIDLFLEDKYLHPAGDEDFFVNISEIREKLLSAIGEDVSVEFFETEKLSFHLPREEFRKVPVRAMASVSYKSQYMPVGGIVLSPDSVLVYGSEVELEGVTEVRTSTIFLRGISKREQGFARLEPVGGLRLSHSSVVYSLDVKRYVENTGLVDVEIRGVPKGKSVILIPSQVEIVYRFPFDNRSRRRGAPVLYVNYEDCVNSSGSVIPKISEEGLEILDYRLNPRLVECILSDERK